MKSSIEPLLTPVRIGDSSPHLLRSEDFAVEDISTSNSFSDTYEQSNRPTKIKLEQAGKPSTRKSLLTTLVEPFTGPRRKRHDSKTLARSHIQLAMNLFQTDDTKRKEAHDHLSQLIKHCDAHHLDLKHELSRAVPSTKHPLTQMLDWGEYDALAILAPALRTFDCGSTLVRRTSDGVYVGQGIKRPGRNGEIVWAHGRGLFIGADGRRVEGQWCDNKPTNITLYPESGPIEFKRGTLKDGHWSEKCLTKYRSGDTFCGHWENGARHGPGIITMIDGSVLRGVWRKDALLPGARYEMEDGRIYHGDINLEAGKLRGNVTIAWSGGQKCGARYEGPVEGNEPQGMGRYTFSPHEEWSGYVYNGPWLDGKKHGAGILIRMVDGRRFDCAFTDDILHHRFCPD